MLKKLRDRRGSGVIEFLGLMPLVILIALAVWQFAIVGYGIINTQAAARDGVRVAATKPDEANILKTVRTSFGEDTKYYRLDNVDINNDGVDAKVTVNVSFFTVLLPKSVIIPFQWKATAPIYSDKAQVNVTSSNGSLPEGPPSGSLPEVGQSDVNLPGVALPNVSLASSANNGVQSVQSNGQETKSWLDNLKDTVSNAPSAVTETLGAAWDWTKAHKEEIASGLTVAAGVGLLFVPGGQGLGAAILIGAALGGGLSALAGNDAMTIMRDISVGGMAGAASVAVAALASVGVAATIGRIVTNPAVRKFIPLISGSIASGAGGSSYSVANDLLHERKVNWKNAAITGALAMTLTVGGAYVLKQGIPALGITQAATSQRIIQVDGAIGTNVNRVVGIIPGADTQIAKVSSLTNKLGTKPILAPAITQVANQTIKQADVAVGALGKVATPRLEMNLQLFAKGAVKDVTTPTSLVREGQTSVQRTLGGTIDTKSAISGGSNTGGQFQYYKNLVEELDVSTSANSSTFYSGIGNRNLAEQFANINQKIKLETTPGGKYLDDLKLFEEGSPLSPGQAAQIWSRLSERYAQQSSGNVYGFVNGSRPGSIFNTVEYPALRTNVNVTNVFTEFFK